MGKKKSKKNGKLESLSDEQKKLLGEIDENEKLRKEVTGRLKKWAEGGESVYDESGMRLGK